MSEVLNTPDIQVTEYSVYARVNDNNKVDWMFSDCFEEPLESDVLIKTGYGDEYIHVGYYNIYTVGGAHRYKIVDGALTECTEEEIAAELAAMAAMKREVYAADLNELQSISGGKLTTAGWYRIAKYTGGEIGKFANSCDISIKRAFENTENEYHNFKLVSVSGINEFQSITDRCKSQLITKARYTYTDNAGYIEVYYNETKDEGVHITIDDAKDYSYRWSAMIPEATEETVDGVAVACEYNIPANATSATNLDLDKYLPLTGGVIGDTIDHFPLVIKGRDSGKSWIGFRDSTDANLGFLGMTGKDNPVFIEKDKETSHRLLHTGNMADYALPRNGEIITTSIKEKALTLSNGIHYFMLAGTAYTGEDLPDDNAYTWLYSSAIVTKRNEYSIAIMLIDEASGNVAVTASDGRVWGDWNVFASMADLKNIQSTSKLILSAAGWYRVAEYTNSDTDIGPMGVSSNSCEILLKRQYGNVPGEAHKLILESRFKNQKFDSVYSMCNNTSDRLLSKIRYTYDSKKAYLEIYYDSSNQNTLCVLINDGIDCAGNWKAITPVLTEETVEGVTVTTTYDIPVNAAPVFTDLSNSGVTLYVDNVNGSDSNDGLTVNTPIKTIHSHTLTRYTSATTAIFKLLTDYTGKITLPRSVCIQLQSNDSANPVTINGTVTTSGIPYGIVRDLNIVSSGASDIALNTNGSNLTVTCNITSAYCCIAANMSLIQINKNCNITCTSNKITAISSQKGSIISIDENVVINAENNSCISADNGGIVHVKKKSVVDNSTYGTKFDSNGSGIITIEGELQNTGISGSYTGNGDATTQRIININGTGRSVLIRAVGGAGLSECFAIVTESGYIAKSGNQVTAGEEVYLDGNNVRIESDSQVFNTSGRVYFYQRL